ncbi:MAG TPA: aconitate hydratase, partial [Candidatus Polarisedimenticolaceae bacterium]|nr:aconitate hydratase [Candidatus Polarisedimenticolaceae bacterium]
MATIDSTPEFVEDAYRRIEEKLEIVRRRLGRSLTFAEKVLLGHLDDPEHADLRTGESYIQLRPDRVAMQDATAQMALLQFAQADIPHVAVPTTVHADHLIRAYRGANQDMQVAIDENNEVYAFLQSASARYGIGFWQPGAGIIHQVVLENYAFPGGLMIGTDSHTPNAGGLGMFASGVGGADAVDVMAGFPWEVRYPNLIGVRLTGKLDGWAAPKDVILKLAGILTVTGGTNAVVEYFGPGAASISCTGKATITNMGAEIGATTSIFPFDASMGRYLRGTERAALAELAERHPHLLQADDDVARDPDKFFSRVIEIDLSSLEPHLVGPHTPDLARPVSEVARAVEAEGYPNDISVALIGSCTNSSYEDISRVADVVGQAQAHGMQRAAIPLMVTPGSEQVRATIERDGQMARLESFGATVLANACGPCIGQWQRDEIKPGQRNTIVTSFNRNFPRRNDGNAETMAFIASPEIVAAYALAGKLEFDPRRDEVRVPGGAAFRLSPPAPAPDLPADGFVRDASGYVEPPRDGASVEVRIAAGSQRLQRLAPFADWDGRDFDRLPLLLKVKGKCTTDHISPAGPWLRFRGHLDNISDNMFTGASNSFTEKPGTAINTLDEDTVQPVPKVARAYKEAGIPWVVIGDDNYGEGSSREHAAMEVRFLGGRAVIARSFARIAETNLKKQGVLALTFDNPADYDKFGPHDRVSVRGLASFAPEQPLHVEIEHPDGSRDTITVRHS